jgi:hypothetical protein
VAPDLLIAVCAFVCFVCWRALPVARAKGLLPAGCLSAVVAIGTLLAVLPEYYQLGSNAQKFTIQKNGGYTTETVTHYAPGALYLFAMCLLGFLAGEVLFVYRSGRARTARVGPKYRLITARRHTKAFIGAGIIIGTAMAAALGRHGIATASQLATRGTSHGKGILSTGTWLVPGAMIVALSNRQAFWTRNSWLAILAVTAAIGLTTGTRSPLVLVGAYFVVVTIRHLARRRHRTRTVIKAIAGAYVILTLISVISLWRGHLTHQGQAQQSLSSSIVKAAENPVASLPTFGNVNTLDGAIFVQIVHQEYGVRAGPSSWGDAVELFVPSQLWHNKPTPLSGTLSAQYLGFGASGMFLSGPGYAWLTLYGQIGALLWAIGFGWTVAWLCRTVRTGSPFSDLFRALIVYFTIEMWFAGDSFVIYYVGAIAIACAICIVVGRAAIDLSPRPAPGSTVSGREGGVPSR